MPESEVVRQIRAEAPARDAQQKADLEAAYAASQSSQKNVNQQKAAVEQQAGNQQTSSGGGGGGGEKTATCPVCSDKAKGKGKSSGKYIINLNLFFTKVVIRIPKIFDFIPKTVTFDANLRKGEKCGACEGKKQLPDVQQSDAGKYQQAAQQLEAKMPQIMEQEAKLGLGGARTTIIQGNDTLQVGALFNSNSSYRIEKDKGIAISKLQGGKETVLPNGGKCNAVVPVPGSLGWPSAIGNYTIKCGNSFQVEAGGGGINLSTKGPIELNGGITTIKAPQITLGCEQGPLKIGADSVDITGRFVNISPTEGNFYVRGTVNASGNMVTGGHSHAQSMSFIKAACCGTNQTSTMDQGNKDVSQTQNAVWGGIGYKAITTSLLDLQMFFADIPMDIKNALFRLISPGELTNTVNRMQVLTNMCYPIELEATGLAIGYGVSIVYNYPHTHGLQPMQHTHNMRVPDMDFSADDPQALIQKVLHGGTEGSAPGEAVRDSLLKKVQALMESISSLFSIVKQLPETISSTLRLG